VQSADFKKVIVEKIKMPTRQTSNLGQRVIHQLSVKSPPPAKSVLITECAMMRTTA
jgi:hypothetical protein